MDFPFGLDCGAKSARVENIKKSSIGTLDCDNCGLSKAVLVNSVLAPVYEFGSFIYIDSAVQEIMRLEGYFGSFGGENEGYKIKLIFSLLQDLCKAKAAEALEDDDALDLAEVFKWEKKGLEYNRQLEWLEEFVKENLGGSWNGIKFTGRDGGGSSYPYPYVFKPPSPPDDIGVVMNVQVKRAFKEETSDSLKFCLYCGSKLRISAKYCRACGKKF